MTNYDVIVVGGGPGGYVAAIRAAKEGKKTALVEKDFLGGTCLNRGCIPSKTLLKHAEIIEQIEKAQGWGIETSDLSFDLTKMLARKDEVIQTLRNGIQGLLQAGKIDVFAGHGVIQPNKTVQIDEDKSITANNIIIATGSRPFVPPISGVEDVSFHTTDTIFDIEKIPEKLVIVGGGVIGVELANIFASLKTEVTVIELGDRIIPTEDKDASKALLKSLKQKGVKVLLNHQVHAISEKADKKEIHVLNKKDESSVIEADALLIAVGRTPNTEAFEQLQLKMDGKFVQVNDYLETSEKGVFAVGDVIGNLQLAHVASSEGLVAAQNLTKQTVKMNYDVMPRCIYTTPQVATVGKTETQLKEQNIAYKSHVFQFSSNGMALATGETDGFSKVLIDEKYGEILGVVMVGAHVTEMISQSSAYMYLEGTVDELANMVQPHPSLSEALMESANNLIGKGIHTV
ncbi:MAG TPA: dihydrolipoyl dehydrogenase [Pseudogracilibacillus sp.]|nr:dihydrolipoyl dehydrogenase [Pseudogracilibacillus sp.]